MCGAVVFKGTTEVTPIKQHPDNKGGPLFIYFLIILPDLFIC